MKEAEGSVGKPTPPLMNFRSSMVYTRNSDVEAELACLSRLSRNELAEFWRRAYGRPPPKGLSRRLLEQAAAYRIQQKAFGGLSSPRQRKLLPRANGRPTKAESRQNSTSKTLAPGSRLMREWHGKTIAVEVLDQGFSFEGQRYKSLSEIARIVTGARWSGPRFFGL